MATISQIFNQDISTKKRVLLEKDLIDMLVSEIVEQKPVEKEIVQIDNLVYRTFTEKFNNKYKDSLLMEQKKLLGNYIMSFADNSVGLKMYVGEELERIQKAIEKVQENKKELFDHNMHKSLAEVKNLVESYKKQPIDEEMLKKLLKIQTLISEIED